MTPQVRPHSKVLVPDPQRLLVLAQLGMQRDGIPHQGHIIRIDLTCPIERSASGVVVLVRSGDDRVDMVSDVRVWILAQCGLDEVIDLFTLGLGGSRRVVVRKGGMQNQSFQGEGF